MNEPIREDEIDLKAIWIKVLEFSKILLKAKWKLLAAMLVAALIGFGYTHFTKEAFFTSRTTFLVEEKSGGSGLSSLASQFGFGGAGGDGNLFTGENLMLLIKSNRILEQTLLANYRNNPDSNLYNQYLVRNYQDEIKEGKATFISSSLPREAFSRAQDSSLVALNKSLVESIYIGKVDKKAGIIELVVKGGDEQWTLDFSRLLLKECSNLYMEIKIGKSMQNLRVMENRLDSVQRQLGNTMFGIAEETDQSLGIIQAKPRVSKMKKELQAQILSGLNAELVKNIELTKFAIDREQPVIEVLDVPRMPLPKTGQGSRPPCCGVWPACSVRQPFLSSNHNLISK